MKKVTSESASEVEDSLERLYELLDTDDNDKDLENIEIAFNYGALVICRAMEKYHLATDILINALGVLIRITYHDKQDINKSLINLGVIELCLKAMSKFPNHALVSSNGITLLGNLMVDDNLTKKVILRHQNDGLKAIVNAMNYHKNEPILQERGCFALCRCASSTVSDIGASKVAEVGGIDAIISAMTHEHAKKETRYNGSCAIYNLAINSTARKQLIINAGGLEAVAMTQRYHANDQMVSEAATDAMCILWNNSSSTSSVGGIRIKRSSSS